jgi:hypothetical protein
MPNLMITTYCNFTCQYCFGRDMIGPEHTKTHMTWETFLALLEWIQRAQMERLSIHLMGGEPTLNPLFFDMLNEVLGRNLDLLVFSNAAIPLDQSRLQEAVRKGARWVVNCNHPSQYQGNQLEILKANLAILGKSACVTFNVTGGDFDYGYVFDYIKTFGLNPRIKVGVALPTLQHHNVFAQWEEFPAIAEQIMILHEAATAIGGNVDFECGVPYCLFTEEQHRKLGNVLVSGCNSRLDITPWGDVINCLPLSKMTMVPYNRFSDYAQAKDWFTKLLMPYRQVGSRADCLTCESRLKHSCHACHAYGIGEFNRLSLPPLPENKEKGDGTR